MTDKSIQEGVEATQESKAITSSTEKSPNSPKPDDGLAECDRSRTRIHDPLITNQEPGLKTPPRLKPPAIDEQSIKKDNDTDAISPSRRQPTTDSLFFTPKYLSGVFLSVTPPVRVQCLLNFLSILIKVYYNYHRVAEADLLTIYSTLLVDSAEQPDYAPL